MFVQNNNAIILQGESAVKVSLAAFEDYWANDAPGGFGKTTSARWNNLGIAGVDGRRTTPTLEKFEIARSSPERQGGSPFLKMRCPNPAVA